MRDALSELIYIALVLRQSA